MTDKPSVALVGAGSMGGALLRGWLETGAIDIAHSAVFDPGISADMTVLCKSRELSLNPEIETGYDVLVVAVKPQMAAKALPQYAAIAKDAIVVSVMAGKSTNNISAALGGAVRIARAMPNLPAAIGKGISGLYATETIDAAGRDVVEHLLRAAGKVTWVETEEAIDFVTAVSGSGPAYFFLLTETLADAGEALGLDKQAAAVLARATLAGAGALIDVETRTPAEMRKAVTSPGGTTEAALNILEGDSHALRALVKDAVAAAAKRAKELTN
ncbi:pyrroline-5-carboxylate reductase [Hyphococcus flavus]|uniref:Pyrroline-5-carboxylate reductase n=1 Tax=Hyphococcus flavus TaxID=1866326 RepID=A0AAE9ZBZ4_9PROT|nr:pyrroline-5-carboxylate reductase [Hyphococcus flavus]WDI30590.1 pyrroline-5-carboxylate reductase [Hyphococcus flavus]